MSNQIVNITSYLSETKIQKEPQSETELNTQYITFTKSSFEKS